MQWGSQGRPPTGALRHKEEPSPGEDPRAEELRHKLDESRTMVEEREEFESAETPVDEVIGPEPEVDDRRKAVHDRGRAAAEEMRGQPPV